MTLLQTFFPEMHNSKSTEYNLIKVSDSQMLLELNVAGILEKDIDVGVSGNKLSVSATASDLEERDYIRKGIHTKSFKRSFGLRDDVVVKSAGVKNGILSVSLEVQVPEEKKPRKIPLTH